MIPVEMQNQIFGDLLVGNNEAVIKYFGSHPDHLNDAMNEAGDTIFTLAQRYNAGRLLVALNALQATLDNPYISDDSYLDSDEEEEQLTVDFPVFSQCSSEQSQRLLLFNLLQELISKNSHHHLPLDAKIDFILTVNSLIQIYQSSTEENLKKNLQTFFDERDIAIRGTRLDYCFYNGNINQALVTLVEALWYSEFESDGIPKTVFDVLMQQSLNTLPNTSGDVEPYVDPIMLDPISLPTEPGLFVRDLNGYIHRTLYFDEGYEKLKGIFPSAIEQLTLQESSNKSAVRMRDELWLNEDARLRQGGMLAQPIRQWLVNRYSTFKKLDDYVKQFELYDMNNEAKQQFYNLVSGLYAGGKKNGSGTEQEAGIESTLAVANFSKWLSEFEQNFPHRFQQLMNAKVNIVDPSKGHQEEKEIKNLSDILFPILHPDQALKKDKNLLCSDQNGTNLKLFLADINVQNIFDSFAAGKNAPEVKSNEELMSLIDTAREEITASSHRFQLVGIDIMPAGFTPSAAIFKQMNSQGVTKKRITQVEYNQLIKIFNQQGMSDIFSHFKEGSDNECWKIALQVLRSEKIDPLIKTAFNYHQMKIYLMASYIKDPNAQFSKKDIESSIQQAINQPSNESPWISQLIAMTKLVNGRYKIHDHRFVSLKAGDFVVHHNNGCQFTYKIVDRIRSIAMSNKTDGSDNRPSVDKMTEHEKEASDFLRLRQAYTPVIETSRVDNNGERVFEYPEIYDDVYQETELKALDARYWYSVLTRTWNTKCVNDCGRCYKCQTVVSRNEENGKWYDGFGNLIGQRLPTEKKLYKEDIYLNLHQEWHNLSQGKEGKCQTLQPVESEFASLMDYAIVSGNRPLIQTLLANGAKPDFTTLFNVQGKVVSSYLMRGIILALSDLNISAKIPIAQLRIFFNECRRLNQPLLLSKIIEIGLPVNDAQINLKVDPSSIDDPYAARYRSIWDLAIKTKNQDLIKACINSSHETVNGLIDLYKFNDEIRSNYRDCVAKRIVEQLFQPNVTVNFQGEKELREAVLNEILLKDRTALLALSKKQIINLLSLSVNEGDATAVLRFFQIVGLENGYFQALLQSLQTNPLALNRVLQTIYSDERLVRLMVAFVCLLPHEPNVLKMPVDNMLLSNLLSIISQFTLKQFACITQEQWKRLLVLCMQLGEQTLFLKLATSLYSQFPTMKQEMNDDLLLVALNYDNNGMADYLFQQGARLPQEKILAAIGNETSKIASNYLDLFVRNNTSLDDEILNSMAQTAFEFQRETLLLHLLQCGLKPDHRFIPNKGNQSTLLGLCIAGQRLGMLKEVVSCLEKIEDNDFEQQDEAILKHASGSVINAYLEGVKIGSNDPRKVKSAYLAQALRNATMRKNAKEIKLLLGHGANGEDALNQIQYDNIELLPVLLQQCPKQRQQICDTFLAAYDALYQTNAFINLIPFRFFRTSHHWQNKSPCLDDIVAYCKKNPSSRSTQALKIVLNHHPLILDNENPSQDKSALFRELHQTSCKSSFFSLSHTTPNIMQSETTILDYIKKHQGSRSEVIAHAIGIK